MTDDELKAIDQRLAAMSERVEAVIAKESRGKPMPVLDFKPRSRPISQAPQPRPKAKYVPAVHDEDYWRDQYPSDDDLDEDGERKPAQEGSIEQIFADFERQFDEMAQAHRNRA